MPKDDPFEFDPFSDMEQPPAQSGGALPEPLAPDAGELSELELFEQQVAAEASAKAAKAKALRLDFSDVLGSEREVRGAKRVGAAVIETDQFLSKKEVAAMERAKIVPRVNMPSLIDQEERMSGTKVVAESNRFWVWLVLIALVPLALLAGGAWMYVSGRNAKLDREIEELRQSEDLHRKAADKREQDLLR